MGRSVLIALLIVVLLSALPSQLAAAPLAPNDASTSSFMAVPPPHAPSLESMLAPDGTLTLTSGFEGSVDVSGWRMETLPDGRPRFERDEPQVQPAPGGDENWDPRFWNNGTSGDVNAMAVMDGDLYVGGNFLTAGSLRVNNLARYSVAANTWNAVGFGVAGAIHALAVAGSTLYLGGSFGRLCADAGCTATEAPNGVNNLAAWNGTNFTALGNGVDNLVNALAVNGSTLYVGGEFTLLCVTADCTGSPVPTGANNIVAWNGSRFTTLGNGLGGPVRALAVSGPTLYAGGEFTLVCTNADCSATQTANGMNRIAAWNGTSFTALGNGVNERVLALATSGPTVYLGGAFTLLCNAADCSTTQPANGVNRIVAWNGTNYTPLGNGLPSLVTALSMSGTTLYIGGQFSLLCASASCSTTQAANGVNRLAAWNSVSFSVLGQGVDNAVAAIAIIGNTVFAGGTFSRPCDNVDCTMTRPARGSYNIAGFDGFGFTQLPPAASQGVSRQVNTLAVMQGSIYVGGDFRTAGQMAANRIARYTPATNTWSTLGFGVNNQVFDLAVTGSTLYLAGSFTRICANADCTTTTAANGVNRIAAWNGSAFVPLANGVNAVVRTLAVDGSALYLGGDFTRLCNDAPCSLNQAATGVNRVALWNGGSLRPLGNGVNAGVASIAVLGATVYIGGSFTLLCADLECNTTRQANGFNRIAAWNGITYSPLANGLNSSVSAMDVRDSTLYLGGAFTRLCSSADCLTHQAPNGVNRVASWNGNSFGALANGVNGSVFTLSATSTTLYLGGSFNQICANPDCSSTTTPVRGVSSWNDIAFSPLGSGVNAFVFSVLAVGGDVYVGGSLSTAGANASGFIGRYGEMADLSVAVTASTTTAQPGSVVSYTVTLANSGPATALNTTLSLDLPTTASLGSITASQGICTTTGCTIEAMPPGQIVTVTVGMTLTAGSSATLIATDGSNQMDSSPNENTARATVVIAQPTVVPTVSAQRGLSY